jgi:hypothetical protein
MPGEMPRLKAEPRDGRIPTGPALKLQVDLLLKEFDAVIALTDVYTGTNEFLDAADAKSKMRAWVGNENRFHPHAAQYDFEAWLIPYWPRVQSLTGSNRQSPSLHPETINHGRPPSHHLKDIFRTGGKSRRRYVKPRDAQSILSGQDLGVAASQCPELKSFLNTILGICRKPLIP